MVAFCNILPFFNWSLPSLKETISLVFIFKLDIGVEKGSVSGSFPTATLPSFKWRYIPKVCEVGNSIIKRKGKTPQNNLFAMNILPHLYEICTDYF
jgi:hypothetical protein